MLALPPRTPNKALHLYSAGGVSRPQIPHLCWALRPPKLSTFKISPFTSNLIDSPVDVLCQVSFKIFLLDSGGYFVV